MTYFITAFFILGTKRHNKINWNLSKQNIFPLIVIAFLFSLIWLLFVIKTEYPLSSIEMKQYMEPLKNLNR